VSCAARMKCAKLLLQKFPQYATDFVFFMDKRCSRSLHQTVDRTKSVADCGNFFSVGTAWSATAPPVNCACVPQLFEQLINITLCPAYLGKFVCQPLRCVPLRLQTFYQNLVLVTYIVLTVDKHCRDVYGDEFPMPQIDRQSK